MRSSTVGDGAAPTFVLEYHVQQVCLIPESRITRKHPRVKQGRVEYAETNLGVVGHFLADGHCFWWSYFDQLDVCPWIRDPTRNDRGTTLVHWHEDERFQPHVARI